mmetsp:Transcript_3819/g.10528  ORF Transcript_3819/g.10528 Transcript_3819/m.10528 type:complete len:200 (-) Transcript_3819:2578-3177(-)
MRAGRLTVYDVSSFGGLLSLTPIAATLPSISPAEPALASCPAPFFRPPSEVVSMAASDAPVDFAPCALRASRALALAVMLSTTEAARSSFLLLCRGPFRGYAYSEGLQFTFTSVIGIFSSESSPMIAAGFNASAIKCTNGNQNQNCTNIAIPTMAEARRCPERESKLTVAFRPPASMNPFAKTAPNLVIASSCRSEYIF